MNWFKETWWIIKQLFTKVKADKVEYKHMDHYPFCKEEIYGNDDNATVSHTKL